MLFTIFRDENKITLLLLIPNEFGTVFELGVQRLETLEELEIQYSHNRLLEVLVPVKNISQRTNRTWYIAHVYVYRLR